ncbi:MAG: M14 family metallopeptidase [Vicinamibacterales bacterium]
MRRLLTAALLCLVSPALMVGASDNDKQNQANLEALKTVAESSGYRSTSTYAEVLGFMQIVDQASPIIHMTSYGTTHEGRMMPLAVVGTGLKDASPASVLASGKTRIHIQGNIHAGEVEGKEATLVLLRELAQGKHAEWLDSMVLLITPIFNADGNERFGLRNRGRQNGPINGMGTRANAQNININRDFMKLESPEGRAFVKLWNDYNPHVGMDLHTSDGSTHAYHLTYSPPLNPNTNAGIMAMMKDEWFPFITEQVRAKHKWETYYYGNVSDPSRGGGRGARGGAPGAPGRAGGAGAAQAAPPPQPASPLAAPQGAPAGQRAWATFEHVPRFHNNYVGMRNRFALLSEAYAYATFEDRIKATNYFMEEALNFAHRNATRIRQAVETADREALIGKTMATRARLATGGMVEILMGEVEEEKNPIDGNIMNRRKDVIKPEQMLDRMWFEPTSTETAPTEYYIPASAKPVLDLLRLHGVQMTAVNAPVTGLEQFTITANTAAPIRTNSIDFGGHALRTLTGTWGTGGTAPAGSFRVSLAQPLGRLVFYLLEPTSDDGVTNWNFLDDVLGKEGVTTYPILRKR